MDEIIQALAHAIRNPLTGISINVQYLQMVYGQSSAQREIYADVMEAVARLDQMIREFVEFTGTLTLRTEPVDLNILLSRALAQHDTLLQSRRLKVSSHLDPAVPEIEADLNHFCRALAGLVEHCAWGAEEGGALSVSSRVTSETVILEITRSGPPLSSQRRDTLFDPIAALQGPESGFGMAFCQKILTAHHCRLEVVSRLGQDTRFGVVVPLNLSPPKVST